MKLKLSLRNSARAALLLFSLSLSIGLSGCQESLEPTFKEDDIPYCVRQICKDEYNLDVVTKRTETTLWTYVPLEKILHKEYGLKKDKILDEDMVDKLRNILTTIGRVVLSADSSPEFFALWASDINLGLDYIIIGSVLDIKKSYAGNLPSTELNKRYVMKFQVNPNAVQDKLGRHPDFRNITMPDFLALQIVQRLSVKFQGEEMKKYFQVEKIDGIFDKGEFILEYSIKQLLPPDKPVDIMTKFLDTVTYCVKMYDFRDFSRVEINDLATKDKVIFNAAAIWGRPTPED